MYQLGRLIDSNTVHILRNHRAFCGSDWGEQVMRRVYTYNLMYEPELRLCKCCFTDGMMDSIRRWMECMENVYQRGQLDIPPG